MNAHTLGPWKFGKELTARSGEWLVSFDAGSKGRGIAIAETRAGSGNEEANARLLAAAPALLAAARAARNVIRGERNAYVFCARLPDGSFTDADQQQIDHTDALLQQLDNAINAALGIEP